ncbi:MAG: LysR family transcriptional regulator [Undibacterium sp.]|nr:LysR family transcriptional regulator [Undibacterium sp.]
MAVFVQVVDHGGFSAAARHLSLTTSAVSRHVSRLEKHLGGRLLQRTTRSITLTELGQQVHAACLRMLAEARDVHALAGRYNAIPNGVLRVSAPVVFGQACIAPLLPEFLAQNPEVDVRLTLVDRSVDLVEEGVDVAVRISRELAPGLAARPLCEMSYILIASPEYLAQKELPKHPYELLQHPSVVLTYSRFEQPWLLNKADEQVELQVPSRLRISNSAAILAVVEAGGGIGMVPNFAAASALKHGRVVQVLKQWTVVEPHSGKVYAVYVPGRYIALKTRVLIDFLAEKLA